MISMNDVAEGVQMFAPYVAPAVVIAGAVAVLAALTGAVVRMFRGG